MESSQKAGDNSSLIEQVPDSSSILFLCRVEAKAQRVEEVLIEVQRTLASEVMKHDVIRELEKIYGADSILSIHIKNALGLYQFAEEKFFLGTGYDNQEEIYSQTVIEVLVRINAHPRQTDHEEEKGAQDEMVKGLQAQVTGLEKKIDRITSLLERALHQESPFSIKVFSNDEVGLSPLQLKKPSDSPDQTLKSGKTMKSKKQGGSKSLNHSRSSSLQSKRSNSLQSKRSEEVESGPQDGDQSPSEGYQGNSEEEQQKENLDFAFLYSEPLVRSHGEGFESFEPITDSKDEFDRLYEYLYENRIQQSLKVYKEPATPTSFLNVVKRKPKVLHISCHGNCQTFNGHLTSYLAFESDGEKISQIFPFFEENISHSLQLQGESHKDLGIKLVIISACHSERIGHLFKKAGVPIVIACQIYSQIGADTAVRFCKEFYEMIFNGKTPKNAYDQVDALMKSSQREKEHDFSCCCHHYHKQTCPWNPGNSPYKKCEYHYPDKNCICLEKFRGIHSSNCPFYIYFCKALKKGGKTDAKDVFLCCCRDDEKIPHEELSKFRVIKRSDMSELYENLTDLQLLERDKCDEWVFNKQLFSNQKNKEGKTNFIHQENKCYLPYTTEELKLHKRNVLVFNLIQKIIKKKLINLYGPSGVGRSPIAKKAAKYMYERKKFNDGVFYIDLKEIELNKLFLSELLNKLDSIIQNDDQQQFLEQICNTVKDKFILIILDNCDRLIDNQIQSKYFQDSISYIGRHTQHFRLLMISQNKIEYEDKTIIEHLQVQELNSKEAIDFVWNVIRNSEKSLYKSYFAISEHKYFQKGSFKPDVLIEVSKLIMEGQDLDKIESIASDQILNGQSLFFQIALFQLDLQVQNSNSKIEVLYILNQFPGGLFERDLENICQNPNNKEYQIIGWNQYLQSVSYWIYDKNSKPNEDFLKQSIDQFKVAQVRQIDGFLHFMIDEKFKKPIEQSLEKYKRQIKFNFENQVLKYTCIIARSILKSSYDQVKNNLEAGIISPHINTLTWKQHYPDKSYMIIKPLLHYRYLKKNFLKYFKDAKFIQNPEQVLEILRCVCATCFFLNDMEEYKQRMLQFEELFQRVQNKLSKNAPIIQGCFYIMKQSFQNIPQDKTWVHKITKENQDLTNYQKIIEAQNIINSKIPIDSLILFDIENLLNKKSLEISYQFFNKYNDAYGKGISRILQAKLMLTKIHLSKKCQQQNWLDPEKESNKIELQNIIESENIISDVIVAYLKEAIKCFRELNIKSHEATCYKYRSIIAFKVKQPRNLYKAKNNIQKAIDISKQINIEKDIKNFEDTLNSILLEIRQEECKRLFFFSKAYPLVEIKEQAVINIGPLTKHMGDFRRLLIKGIESVNKAVFVKFDILNRKLLSDI